VAIFKQPRHQEQELDPVLLMVFQIIVQLAFPPVQLEQSMELESLRVQHPGLGLELGLQPVHFQVFLRLELFGLQTQIATRLLLMDQGLEVDGVILVSHP
jgi:hypothetical protein